MTKKRANGEGSLRKRPNGTWQLTFMIGYKENGKRKYKSFSGRTQAEVKKKAGAYLQDKAAGINVDSPYSFSEWTDTWFGHHKTRISPTTQVNYTYTLRILKDYFKDKPIIEIKPFDIEVFLSHLVEEGRSSSYISKCRALLYQMLNKAEANDLIRKNPVRFVDRMRHRGPVERRESFTVNEVAILMQELPEDRIGYSIRLLLGTGMRSQELLALEPRHISRDGSSITVEQAINMDKGTSTIGFPKTQNSYRMIPVPENLRYCALALRDTDKKYIWETHRKKNHPCNPTYFRKEFRQALEAIPEVRVLTPHSCRHTYVSQMIALGVDLATVMELVGHSTTRMTERYLHVQREAQLNAAERFSNAFPTNRGSAAPPDNVLDLSNAI